VKALSKTGHNSMPKGRSILGRGIDLRISKASEDILAVEDGDSYVCSERRGGNCAGLGFLEEEGEDVRYEVQRDRSRTKIKRCSRVEHVAQSSTTQGLKLKVKKQLIKGIYREVKLEQGVTRRCADADRMKSMGVRLVEKKSDVASPNSFS